MKTRNGLTATLTIIIGLGLMSTPVLASSKQHHRWEGVAIGVGAAIAAGALIKHYKQGPGEIVPVGAAYHLGKPHRYMTRHRGTCTPRYRYHQRHRHSQPSGYAQNWRHHHRGHRVHKSFNRGHRYWQARDGFHLRERSTHLGQRRYSRGRIVK